MEKKTAMRPRSHRTVSAPMHDVGLIVTGTPTERSAVTQCALDDRSHRTERWCRRRVREAAVRSESGRTILPCGQRAAASIRLRRSTTPFG